MDGNELRRRRKLLGYTQKEIAEALELSADFVGLMERGARPISSRTARAVERLTPRALDRTPELRDPLERLVESALIDAGIEYQTEVQIGEDRRDRRLDFYLPRYDIAIEVKRFYTARTNDQLARSLNIILLQGETSVRAFAALIRNGGFSALEFELASRGDLLRG